MRMRPVILALSVAVAGIAAADDLVIDPIQYLKIVADSSRDQVEQYIRKYVIVPAAK